MPKISVIIPIYNVEKYLRECLDSVINQTVKDIEIICVNDGSTDNSLNILEEYALRDKRITIINKKNGGLSSARNEGLKYISGELCHFLDSDDFIEQNLYENAISIFQNFNIDYFCFSSKSFIDGEGVIQNQQDMDSYIYTQRDGLYDVCFDIGLDTNIHVWNKIFKTSKIKQNNLHFIEGLLYEDIYFMWMYVFLSKKVYFVNDTYHHYRMRSNSIMEKTTQNLSLKTGIDHLLNWYELFKTLSKDKYFFLNNFDNLYKLLEIYTIRTREMVPNNSIIYVEKLKQKYLLELNYTKNVLDDNHHSIIVDNKIKYKPIEKIFSIKTNPDGKHKILRFAFIKIKLQISLLARVLKVIKKENNINYKNETCFKNNEIIASLKNFNDFYFLPNKGNLGDMAIATACYQFFDSMRLNYKIIDMTRYEEYLNSTINLVYGGGGLFTSYYCPYYQDILKIFKSKNLKQVIILPASFYDCDDVLECLDERFTVFCREKNSLDYCLSKNNKAKFILADDMVLSLNTDFINIDNYNRSSININYKHTNSNSSKNLYKYYLDVIGKFNRTLKNSSNIGYFFRTDKEANKDIIKEVYSLIDLSLVANSFCFDKSFTNIMLKNLFRFLDCYDYIVTDRLHIGICSALLNKKVLLLDNSYKKLSGVIENSMSNYNNIRIFSNFDEIKEILNKENNIIFEENKNVIPLLSYEKFLALWLSEEKFNAEKCYWSEVL